MARNSSQMHTNCRNHKHAHNCKCVRTTTAGNHLPQRRIEARSILEERQHNEPHNMKKSQPGHLQTRYTLY